MRKAIVISFLALSVLLRANLDVRDYRLDNGLKVIFSENHSAPVVAVQVWYRVGSKNEVAGIRGISHLLEHMMFKGSESVGPEEHMRQVSKAGGRSNAFTSEDVTVYHQVMPSKEIELPFRLEAERMERLKLEDRTLKTEREVVKEELRVSIENSPWGMTYERLLKALFRVHAYRFPVIGTMEDLNRITLDDLKNYYQKYYAPDNATLVVVGDVTLPEVEELVKKYFAPVSGKRGPGDSIPSEPVQTEEHVVDFKIPTQTPVTGLAYHIPEASNPDIPALEVVIDVLVRGESARLSKRLVRQEKLCLWVDITSETMQDPGYIAVYGAFVPGKNAMTVTRILLEELDRLKENGISEQELARAKNHLLANSTFGQYSISGQAFGFGHAEVYEGDYRKQIDRDKRYDALTIEDVRMAAQKYLRKENRTRYVVIPVPASLDSAKRRQSSTGSLMNDWGR